MTSLKMMVDSYFEGLIEGNFKTAADGRRLFYPWGEWVKDRVLTDARTQERIGRC